MVQIKSQVRALIFGGLADPVRKIRLAAVRSATRLASSYPNLCDADS